MSPARPVRLSKSRVIAWRQCPRRLWLEAYRPDLRVVTEAMQRGFDHGHDIGAAARALYPGGVLVDPPTLGEALRQTTMLLAYRGDLTLFEATFRHAGVLVRADLLFRTDGSCRMVEVKGASAVKPYHVEDAAVQAWVVRGAGVPLERVGLMLPVWRPDAAGVDDPPQFDEIDVTAQVDELIGQVPGWVGACGAVLAGDEPDRAVSPACAAPFSCPFVAHCSSA